MKKIKLSLFVKVLIAIVLGSLIGLVAPDVLVRIFKTFNVIFAQILKFIVPLLVLGLVTPAIADLGRGAGKMMIFVMVASYCSTVCASLFTYGSVNLLFPHYLEVGELSTAAVAEAKTFEPYIDIKFPPICDIMTALLLSFMVGIGIIFTNAGGIKRAFDEFGSIVKLTIESAIIPCLPFYIFTMMCEMSARGVMATVIGGGVKIIGTGVVLSILFLVVQYSIACTFARKNPFKCLYNMLPAYLTGFSICSSSAVIPVTLEGTMKNGVSKDIAGFVVPLCSTVHMCGSAIKLVCTSFAVSYIMGTPIPFAVFLNFAFMQAIAAVAAPGVMSGVLMASIGLVESIFGFTPEMAALMMTIYLALDGYGPAANVTGDGAIAIITDVFFGKKEKTAEFAPAELETAEA